MRDGTPTRERIERSAMRLFVAKGVSDTTIRDIAGSSGVAEGALYRHYRGKDELIHALFERHYLAFAQRLRTLAAEQPGVRAKITAMVEECARIFDGDPVLFQFLLLVQHHSMPRLTLVKGTPVEVVRQIIMQAMDNREIPRRDPDLATAFVFGLILQPATFMAYGRLPGPLLPLAQTLADACWRALAS
ncbi:MAG TPA: TetR/AcrR family transcriptional regulator [Stellaceae bacterium]|nr:TetR/AcrR family transcriptional regulator [Stellaceae bacterium]